MKAKNFLFFGYLIPVLFWGTTLICGFIYGEYNHASRLVSELGAIGTSSQYFFTGGLLLSSIFSVLFIIGLIKTARINGLNIIPIIVILTFSISIAGAAIFPLPLSLHMIFGMPSVLLPLSPLLALLLWKNDKIPHVRQYSLLIFLIMSLGFIAFFPDILSEYAGLKQRIFHFGWTLWFVYLSKRFSTLG